MPVKDRSYLTIKQYCKKYDIPRTTVQGWIKDGTLEAIHIKRPYLIPDDQPIPVKDDGYYNGWRYRRNG